MKMEEVREAEGRRSRWRRQCKGMKRENKGMKSEWQKLKGRRVGKKKIHNRGRKKRS